MNFRGISVLGLAGTFLVATVGCVANANITAGVNGQVNRSPFISAFTANPSNEAKVGQAISFLVAASDPDGDPMQFNWSASAGMLSTNTGQSVLWTPPKEPGTYTVQVVITDGRGGATNGAQNLTVAADKVTLSPPVIASPPPSAPSVGNSTGASASGKFKLSLMSTGEKVLDFQAFDMNEVWAVPRYKNFLLHTRDGGTTWERLKIREGGANINGVYFVDRQHGWAVGDAGTMFETKDGGASWALVDTGTSKRLRKVIVKPDGTGYAIFEEGTESENECLRGGLLVTRDGGATWKPLMAFETTPHRFQTAPDGRVWGVGFQQLEELKGSFESRSWDSWIINQFWDASGTLWMLIGDRYVKEDAEKASYFPPLTTPSQIYRKMRFYNGATFGQSMVFLTSEGIFQSDDAGATWREPYDKRMDKEGVGAAWPMGRMTLFGPNQGWVVDMNVRGSCYIGYDNSEANLYRIGE